MARQPPPPPSERGSHQGRPHGRPDRWWHLSVAAWTRLRALPTGLQAVLWLLAWPVTGALYVARSRWLGPLAVPLTVVVLVLGGSLWWPILAQEAAPHDPESSESVQAGASRPAVGAGTTAFAGEIAGPRTLPEFDPTSLVVDIVECVQTRSVSAVRGDTIRQPRIVVRLTNHGPARTVVLHGEVLLEEYDWNGGWKPTAGPGQEMAPGQTADVTLLTDYRHQSSYGQQGLRACRITDVEFVAPNVWPEYPARRISLAGVTAAAAPERDFDPYRDLLRTDAR